MGRVYRIETSDGMGAYGVCLNWGDERPFDTSGQHPGPMDDSGLRGTWACMSYDEQDAHYFGFRDEAQMRAWFYRDEWLVALKEAGCKMTVWETDTVRYGHSQAIFRRSQATLVDSYELI